MSKYIVINRCSYQLSIDVPAPHRKTSFSVILAPSNSVDILPFAGTLEECRRIPLLMDLKYRGWVEIIEE